MQSSEGLQSGAAGGEPAAVPGPVTHLESFAASGTRLLTAFSGTLTVAGMDAMNAAEASGVLERLAALGAWAQAQQARALHRMEELIAREVEEALKKPDPVLAMSLAASEAGTVLKLPHMTAMRLLSDADALCSRYPDTLAHLSHGRISYRHAQAVLDEVSGVPAGDQPEFEAQLLELAADRTCAQFTRAARRMRERRWPESILERHRAALERRQVTFRPAPDGMCELSAFVAAERGQAIHARLTDAAKAMQRSGSTLTLDQLRADIFASLVLTPGRSERRSDSRSAGGLAGGASRASEAPASSAQEPQIGQDATLGLKAEIMVLIPADTLFGADDQPAELNGYGPISSEAARRLAQQALHWTGLVQDPDTGEILAVGKRRKVPAGLKRWLQARDGTCRFPGCSVSPAHTEIDHTEPWAAGGKTEHGNLANLCAKHHRYKTLGFWSARQPVPGVLEWKSPSGRSYRVDPQLDYARLRATNSSTGSINGSAGRHRPRSG